MYLAENALIQSGKRKVTKGGEGRNQGHGLSSVFKKTSTDGGGGASKRKMRVCTRGSFGLRGGGVG